MRRKVHWLAGIIIVVIALCAVSAQLWYWLPPGRGEFLEFLVGSFLFAGIPMLAVLAIFLFPLYRPTLRRWWFVLRRSLNLAQWGPGAVVSLAALVLVSYSWSRSRWHRDTLAVPVSYVSSVFVESRGSVMRFGHAYDEALPVYGRLRLTSEPTRSLPSYLRPSWGLSIARYGRTRIGGTVSVPYWVLAALLSISPAVTLARGYRRYRREGASRCLTCGYDLTGNVSGVCPECGTRISAESGPDESQPDDS
jgi:hypothetical protein